MKPKPKSTGCCSVCGRYRQLTESGLLKVHKPHGVLCDGSLQPARQPKPRPTDGWNRARKATIERDDGACRKCGVRSDLEVHHIKERVYGGSDDLENLITLCGNCHAEWTFCEPVPMPFGRWLVLPPARWLLAVLDRPWPANKSAAAYRDELLVACSLLAGERSRAA